jgi:carboxymethylenebutenolidase
MGGYLARPADGRPRPGVLVFMEIFGVNAHIRGVTERIAREGYVALAPDYFHRTGPGVEYGYDDDGMQKGIALLGQLRADEMVDDARAAIEALRSRPDATGKFGAIGFCIGGHMTYLTACETDVRAAASFYGGGIAAPKGPGGQASTLSRSARIGGRILCLFGGRDALIPAAQVDAIREALRAHDVDHEVVVYPDADHGFFCDHRATFHKEAAEDAWRRVKALFSEQLGSH